MRIKHKKYAKITPKKIDVFPLWALLVSLGCIGAVGLFLSSRLANVKKTQVTSISYF